MDDLGGAKNSTRIAQPESDFLNDLIEILKRIVALEQRFKETDEKFVAATGWFNSI